jgi:hypothetical protein
MAGQVKVFITGIIVSGESKSKSYLLNKYIIVYLVYTSRQITTKQKH